MATNTPNYNLIKPDLTEFADIEVLNGNFDKIDAAISQSVKPIATQAEAEAGTNNTNVMTPLRVNQAININGLLNPKTLTSATNIDSLITNGYYRFTTTSNPIDGIITGTYLLEVVGNGTIAYQNIYRTNGTTVNGVYVRSYNESLGGWTPVKLLSAENLSDLLTSDKTNLVSAINEFKTLRTLTASDNIDTLRYNGFYRLSKSTFPNLNISNGTYILEVKGDNTICMQKFTLINTEVIGKTYIRFYNTASGTWFDLQEVTSGNLGSLTTTNKTSLVNAINEVNNKTSDVSQNHYGVATGTNTLTLTTTPTFTSLYAGLTIQFKNTTAASSSGNYSINVNGLGVRNLFNNEGGPIGAGKLKANAIYSAVYDGTNFYLVKGGGESSPIKSVQRGEIAFSNTDLSLNATINPVNANKTIVKYSLRGGGQGSGTSSSAFFRASVTDGTTINFQRINNSNYSCILSYEVIEFEDYVNVSSGTFSMDQEARNIIAPVVDLNKSFLQFSFNVDANTFFGDSITGQLQSGIINFRRTVAGASLGVTWFVVEIP